MVGLTLRKTKYFVWEVKFSPKCYENLMTKEAEQKAILAETYYKEEKMGVNQIALEIGVSKMAIYRYLRHRKVPIGSYQKLNK